MTRNAFKRFKKHERTLTAKYIENLAEGICVNIFYIFSYKQEACSVASNTVARNSLRTFSVLGRNIITEEKY